MTDLSLGIHAWFMLIPFGIFLPLGIVTSRWREPDRGPSWLVYLIPKTFRQKWLVLHVLLNFTSSVCILFSFTVAYFMLGTHLYKAHQYLGVFIAGLSFIQPLNGWFRAKKKSDFDVPDRTLRGNPKRWAWEKFHYTSGGCLMLCGWINCIIGVYIVPLNLLWLCLGFIPLVFTLAWAFCLCRFPKKYSRLETVKLESGEQTSILFKK